MFVETGYAERGVSRLFSRLGWIVLPVFLLAWLLLTGPAARAQMPDTPAPSPVDWLMSRAGVENAALNSLRIKKGKKHNSLKVHGQRDDATGSAARWALKVSGADAIEVLEDEIITLYGAPSTATSKGKVWDIPPPDGTGRQHFILTYQILPEGDALVRVEPRTAVRADTPPAPGTL